VPRSLNSPEPSKQLQMHQMLLVFRRTILHGALRDAVASVDPRVLSSEMNLHAPPAERQLLAGAGIRDDEVFAVPSVLTAEPRLLGYYRLLLGIPQKQMYRSGTGFGAFKGMEDRGRIPSTVEADLGVLCDALNDAMGRMVREISPSITAQDIAQLPVLALGVQIDGSLRNKIGAVATSGVFESIVDIIAGVNQTAVQAANGKSLSLTNAAQRTVVVKLASDPDVVIEEVINGTAMLKVAIEIKGGTDSSNAHNRAGEAEKSHQKASGASDFWTIISTAGLDLKVLKSESPTTKKWFDVSQVLARAGTDWEAFRSQVQIACGI
jgi:hypothetical protein